MKKFFLDGKTRISILYIGMELITVIFFGIDGYEQLKKQARQETYDSLSLVLEEDMSAEYGSEVQMMDYVQSYNGEISYSGTIDTSRIGAQYVYYVLTKKTAYNESVSRSFVTAVNVVD